MTTTSARDPWRDRLRATRRHALKDFDGKLRAYECGPEILIVKMQDEFTGFGFYIIGDRGRLLFEPPDDVAITGLIVARYYPEQSRPMGASS